MFSLGLYKGSVVYALVALVCWCGLVAPWRRQRLVEPTR